MNAALLLSELETREINRVAELMVSPTSVFVFGSNRAGIHGGGAANVAFKEYSARWGQGEGLAGRSYAIPTKDERIDTLPLRFVAEYVRSFVEFAVERPYLTFAVTRVGCGLAGFTDDQIAPLFVMAPANCELPEGWREIILRIGQ
ncbi:MAG TPA: hypothetical protein VGM82_24835 [Gemmatimonadaceae bacterium]|jgi:hypothetical protein